MVGGGWWGVVPKDSEIILVGLECGSGMGVVGESMLIGGDRW